AAATVDALWQASMLIGRGVADRALVLAVETFDECAELYGRGRWLVRGPLVEAAACALLVSADGAPTYHAMLSDGTSGDRDTEATRRRAGARPAWEPLISLALARERGNPTEVSGRWRGRTARLSWPVHALQSE